MQVKQLMQAQQEPVKEQVDLAMIHLVRWAVEDKAMINLVLDKVSKRPFIICYDAASASVFYENQLL